MNKSKFYFFDIIVMPKSSNLTGVVEIELRRFYEFARLSLNRDDNLKVFDELMKKFSIDFDKIVFDETDNSLWEEEYE